MKKTGLFLVGCMMCSGLAAQQLETSSSTTQNEMDSLQITAPTLLRQKTTQGSSASKKVDVPSLEVNNFWQMLQNFRQEYDAQLERWDDIYLLITGIRSNPDYYKLSMPATYYDAPIEQAFSISDWKPTIPFIKEDTLKKTIASAERFASFPAGRQIREPSVAFFLLGVSETGETE